MDNSLISIKEEVGDEDILPTTVLASKIYYIANEEDLLNINGNGYNETELTDDEDEFYEDLFLGKEEVQDPHSSGSEFMDDKLVESSTSGSQDCFPMNELATVQSETERGPEVNELKHKILLCPFCGTEFLNFIRWREHLNDIHQFNKRETLNMEYVSETKDKCKQCEKELKSSLFYLQNHKILHLPFKRFVKCKLCKKVFTSNRIHTHHLVVNHNVSYQEKNKDMSTIVLLCPYCGKEFPKWAKWRHHLYSIHGFNKFENLDMEYISDHKAKCKQCGTDMNTRMQTLQSHKITHLPHKRYFKCKLCEQLFLCTRTHQRHFDKIHNKKDKDYSNAITCQTNATLICPFCGVEFPNYFEWRKHLNSIHEFNNRVNFNMEFSGNNKAKCKQCLKQMSIKRTWTLKQHRIGHLPYHQFIKCKFCTSNFSRFATFKRHFRENHKTQPLPQVQHKFGTNQNKPIMLCPFCGSEFSNTFHWRHHLNNVHEFKNRETLNIEIVSDKEAKCNQCKHKLVPKLQYLQSHKINHLPYKQCFKCALCEKCYRTNTTYNRHMEARHNFNDSK